MVARVPSVSSPVRIAYSGGTLRGLLDTASARFGVYWKYEDGAIVFFYTATRVYQVVAIPGDSKLDTNVVSGASNSGGASSNSAGAGGSAPAARASAAEAVAVAGRPVRPPCRRTTPRISR
ncbi:hypothetical protein OWS73_06585 [Burkholderia sp. 1B3(2022)]